MVVRRREGSPAQWQTRSGGSRRRAGGRSDRWTGRFPCPERHRLRWRGSGTQNAPLVHHDQSAIQPFLHGHPGPRIAHPVHAREKLQHLAKESDRIVRRHRPLVLKRQKAFKVQVGGNGA